jgi:hypothetical protein
MFVQEEVLVHRQNFTPVYGIMWADTRAEAHTEVHGRQNFSEDAAAEVEQCQADS